MDREKQYEIERKAEPIRMKQCTCRKNKTNEKSETMQPTKKVENYYGGPTICDPLGSYTGQPSDEVYEVPVQDVDDL